MKSKRTTPRRRADPHGMPDRDAKLAVWARQRGTCIVCPKPMTDFHHRLRRGVGPTCPCNGVGLCRVCHGEVHSRPRWAQDRGLIVPTWETPHLVPVHVGIGRWLLDHDGGRRPFVPEWS